MLKSFRLSPFYVQIVKEQKNTRNIFFQEETYDDLMTYESSHFIFAN